MNQPRLDSVINDKGKCLLLNNRSWATGGKESGLIHDRVVVQDGSAYPVWNSANVDRVPTDL